MNVWRAWDLLVGKVMGWVRGFVLLLPNLVVAVLTLIAFWGRRQDHANPALLIAPEQLQAPPSLRQPDRAGGGVGEPY